MLAHRSHRNAETPHPKKNLVERNSDTDVNLKTAILNLTEEKVGNSPEIKGTGKDFLNRTVLTQTLRSTINKWDLMKLKSFCKAKDPIIQTNGSLQNGKIFFFQLHF